MRILSSIVLLVSLAPPALAGPLTTAPPDLIPLGSTDLSTVRPLVVAKEGVYVCRSGYDMYVRTKATKDALVRVPPLQHVRLMDIPPADAIKVLCVAVEVGTGEGGK